MKNSLRKFLFISLLFPIVQGIAQNPEIVVLPTVGKAELAAEQFCTARLSFHAQDPELQKLQEVLNQDLLSISGKEIAAAEKSQAELLVVLDTSLAEEAYRIEIDEKIKLTGGSYDAVAMASVSLLQQMKQVDGNFCWKKGRIEDAPEFEYRGLMIDLARRKHDLETIKRVIRLCRWYKVNYLQLHLSDEHVFTFPSKAYPELSTEGWTYSQAELEDLVNFAEARGVELVPELEVPGHAGQLVQKMPEVFGFENPDIHPFTIHMGRERVYEVLDTLIAEIAEVFHSSEFIHIGGDEARFEGMEEDPEIRAFLKQKYLKDMEELYWYFLNQMNRAVKRQGRKTIVWEGFSKEGNQVVDKDITVMAWESMYQLPQDILEAGYKTINVSWKPLYVVNQRKWSPEVIYNWNIFRWENWVPSIPSYDPIQLQPNPGIMGAAMASWDQPAYTELSSLRRRIPAMMEEAWNHSDKPPFPTFEEKLKVLDNKLGFYLSPVTISAEGLSFPKTTDGKEDEQTWFQDKVVISLASDRNLEIRYSLDGSPVSSSSRIYKDPITLESSAELRYRAFRKTEPVGSEMLEYFELQPLKIEIEGHLAIPLEAQWDTPNPYLIRFSDRLSIEISAVREGIIKYLVGEGELTAAASDYTSPLVITDDAQVKVGFFVNGHQVGDTWERRFINE